MRCRNFLVLFIGGFIAAELVKGLAGCLLTDNSQGEVVTERDAHSLTTNTPVNPVREESGKSK